MDLRFKSFGYFILGVCLGMPILLCNGLLRIDIEVVSLFGELLLILLFDKFKKSKNWEIYENMAPEIYVWTIF